MGAGEIQSLSERGFFLKGNVLFSGNVIKVVVQRPLIGDLYICNAFLWPRCIVCNGPVIHLVFVLCLPELGRNNINKQMFVKHAYPLMHLLYLRMSPQILAKK